MEKTVGVCRLLAIYEKVFCSGWVTRNGQKDVLVQSFQINGYNHTKERKEEDSSLYEGYKSFLSEDWFEVVRVDYGVASILSFRVDVLPFSEIIWFGTKITRTKPDDKVELREILRPLHLSLGQHLGSRKILKFFMICNNINEICWTL